MAIRKRMWKTAGGEQRQAWIVDYFDQDGVRRLKTFKRERDAKDWQTTALHEVKQRRHVPDRKAPTVAAAAAAWIARGEAEGLERSTIKQRREHVDLHIVPLLGSETKLSKVDVDAFRDKLLRTRSHALAKKVMTSIKAILKQAKMAHLAADVDKIKTNGRHKKRAEVGVDIPTKAEAKAMLDRAGGRWRSLIITATFTGLRASELRGLRWEDVDFDKRLIRVRERADKWGAIGPLKTATSHRDVPMAPMVVNALKEWRLACPRRNVKKDDDGNVIEPGELHLVFPNGQGKVESLPNIWNRGLAPLQKKAGIVDGEGKPKYGLHALRHFFASWLIDQGFGPKRVQTLMGHSGIKVTYDVYGHLFPQEDDHEKFAAGELALVG